MGTRTGPRKLSSPMARPVNMRDILGGELDNEKKLNDAFDPWIESLSPAERKAWQGYTENDYADINSAMRSGDTQYLPKDMQDNLALILQSLERSSTPTDVRTFRGVNYKPLARMIDQGKLEIGTEIVEPGITSTSTSPKIGQIFSRSLLNKGVIFDMHVPKGTKGAFLKKLSTYGEENEFVLAPGSRLVVTGIKNSRRGLWNTRIVEVTVKQGD